jgi:hypothetical protein
MKWCTAGARLTEAEVTRSVKLYAMKNPYAFPTEEIFSITLRKRTPTSVSVRAWITEINELNEPKNKNKLHVAIIMDTQLYAESSYSLALFNGPLYQPSAKSISEQQ